MLSWQRQSFVYSGTTAKVDASTEGTRAFDAKWLRKTEGMRLRSFGVVPHAEWGEVNP